MSNLAKQLFEGLNQVKEAAQTVAPGLGNFWQDMKQEAVYQSSRGAMELAAALFSGNSFVLYGGGNHPHGHEQERETQQPQPEHERESVGMER